MLLLTQLIQAIFKAPNNKSALENLHNFGPAFISNIINKRARAWNKDDPLPSPPISSKMHNKGNDENNLLASIIANKTGNGEFQGSCENPLLH